MGYGIYRIEKRTKNSIGGIKKENNRTKEEKEAWEKEHPGKTYLPNSDIDWEKTKDNYYFKKDDEWYKTIAKEIDGLELKKAPRKDAILLLDHFVGISPEDKEKMDEKALKGYFKDAYEHIKEEYGHVVNAVVHLDEKTPHMHVVTVPITKDGRLSAKSLTSGSMGFRQVQDRFYKEVSKKYGFKRGEPKAETNREHLEKREWKAKELEKEVSFLESEKARVQEDYRFVVEEKESVQESIAKLQVDESRKKRSLEACQNSLQMIQTDIDIAKTELAVLQAENKSLKAENGKLKQCIEEAKNDLNSLNQQIDASKGLLKKIYDDFTTSITRFLDKFFHRQFDEAAALIKAAEKKSHATAAKLPKEKDTVKKKITASADQVEAKAEALEPVRYVSKRKGR